MLSSKEEFSNSLTSTSSTLAIRNNVSSPGCEVLVHHFDTVAGSLPNCSANYLLVRFFSTRTTLIDLYLLSLPYWIILFIFTCKSNEFISTKHHSNDMIFH